MTPTAYCARLLDKTPTREQAVACLVETFRPEIQPQQLERWTTATLDGTPVQDADPGTLTAEAVHGVSAPPLSV